MKEDVDLKVGDRVYHRMLDEYGFVTATEVDDPYSTIVDFDAFGESEVSTHLLDKIS
jgi:hypothetical protein